MFGYVLRRGLMAALLVLAGNSPSALLITPAQLNKSLNDPKLVLLQIGPKDDYAAGHIPGARLITFDDIALSKGPTGAALELPDSADLRARLEKLGISNDSWIVVTGGADWVSPATRVVFTLEAAGLGARTQLLDGGENAWKRAGLATTQADPPAAKSGQLTLPQDRWVVVDHQWILAHEHDAHIRIIDGRTPDFYSGPGSPKYGMPGGHIAGAKNIPFNSLTDDSLVLLPADSLRRIFTAAGVHPGDTVAAYCHVGQQATVVIFAARLLGIPARLYDGSMHEWLALKLPIVNPDSDAKPAHD